MVNLICGALFAWGLFSLARLQPRPWVLLAAAFHKSAVLVIPFAALSVERGRVWVVTWIAAAVVAAYVLFLQDSVARLQYGYIDAEYQSSGAAIRVAMNLVPALIFLLFSKRLGMWRAERRFWSSFAFVAIGTVFALALSPSSTAVDRLGLYLIPLQLVVLSRLPHAFARTDRAVRFIAGAVVVYSAAVQFVWLNYADTATAWVPYQFYPF